MYVIAGAARRKETRFVVSQNAADKREKLGFNRGCDHRRSVLVGNT